MNQPTYSKKAERYDKIRKERNADWIPYPFKVGNHGNFKVVHKTISDFDGQEVIMFVKSFKRKSTAIKFCNKLNTEK